ncbi:MAG: hypothetical protein GY904_33830 [Planctomycetaceae bacterium]|nr:hypothetical protein [Planctomycetaceae bacterium]
MNGDVITLNQLPPNRNDCEVHLTQPETRNSIKDIVELLASAEMQLAYERDVPHAPVHVEITEMYCTDSFHPKSQSFVDSFDERELKILARLYGDAFRAGRAAEDADAATVSDVLKLKDWRVMMDTAKIASTHLNE